MNWTEGFT